MNKKQEFMNIFRKAEKKYGKSLKRLAGEKWSKPWKTLFVTILSAQSRDETTIQIAENFFKKFPTLKPIAKAPIPKIKTALKSINYYKTKSKHIKLSAKILLRDFKGKLPDTIEELTKLPGVGRKTANLVLTEVYKKPGITVDTHVHRISNVLGIVKTKTPHQTELALQKLAPKKYWYRINRLFVLWGKDVSGRDKKKLLAKLEEKN